jgi:putative endonuclease
MAGGNRSPQDVSMSWGFCFLWMYYVYINYSEKFEKFYIGQTENHITRIALHNDGKVLSSKPYIPWKNVLLIEKSSRSEAIILERKLKNLNRLRLIAFIEKYK